MSVFGPDQRHIPLALGLNRPRAARSGVQELDGKLAAQHRKVLADTSITEDERAEMIADIEMMQSDVAGLVCRERRRMARIASVLEVRARRPR